MFYGNTEGEAMDNHELFNQILRNAQIIDEMHKNIRITFKKKDENKQAWQDACKKYHSLYDSLAFPGGLDHAMTLLNKKDPSIVSLALTKTKKNV